jgi:type I restriction enzyme, S subunit
MSGGWKTKKLGDVCDLLNRGISPKYLEKGGICVLNQKCIRNHQINYEPSRRHDLSEKKVIEGRFIKLGDVLVNSTGTGTLGRVAQVREEPVEPTTVDSHVTIVRPKKSMFHLDFFGYMLVVIEDAIKDAGEGCGGQTELARSVLAEKFFVSFPEQLSEQQRIVNFLDESFKDVAKVKANTEKNLKSNLEIFESYLNNIFTQCSEHWIEKPIGKCFKVRSGDFLPSKAMVVTGDINVYGGNGIAGRHNQKNLSGDHIIIGRVGAKCGNVRRIQGDLWVTDNAFFITEYFYDFDLAFLTRILSQKQLRNTANQAAQPVISFTTIKDVMLHFPIRESEQKQIADRLEALSAETQRLETIYQRKLIALDELKKSLLHEAFKGNLKGLP